MNIGQASALSGLPSKTIRYYESVDLIVPKRQQDNDYRDYSDVDVGQLRFLRRARQVGFSLAQCRELLDLYRDPSRQSAQVKALVMSHVEQLEEQLQNLTSMRDTLLDMAQRCPGDQQSECAIIDDLAQAAAPGMSFTLVDTKP
ncbi:Cu(I)-responsive transcriptional regulator [Marinimicrobium sp. ABcell2]|uniref:Cu(I)-responsive transcriptional regulator n=1 Tax=Marinimicrobium sp. ABcell2 TaxID=3069751 RepID=UPI0027B61C53|nr:Cu(I)-responsive transcriptional regulator [Marinimicrobium sp. ABcell2]MDQ2077325.1 Cu(I)-responsive transcriptional regulator [Marinimicrobium sp. ABcell2]